MFPSYGHRQVIAPPAEFESKFVSELFRWRLWDLNEAAIIPHARRSCPREKCARLGLGRPQPDHDRESIPCSVDDPVGCRFAATGGVGL
jgi:hypothetical protein